MRWFWDRSSYSMGLRQPRAQWRRRRLVIAMSKALTTKVASRRESMELTIHQLAGGGDTPEAFAAHRAGQPVDPGAAHQRADGARADGDAHAAGRVRRGRAGSRRCHERRCGLPGSGPVNHSLRSAVGVVGVRLCLSWCCRAPRTRQMQSRGIPVAASCSITGQSLSGGADPARRGAVRPARTIVSSCSSSRIRRRGSRLREPWNDTTHCCS